MSRSYAEALASTEETNTRKDVLNDRMQQTLILYKINPPTITTNEVIQDIAKSLRVDAPIAMFGVHKDTRYQSRFTVVFKHSKFIEQIKENGLHVGETKIAPKRPKPIRGYLPNLPVYALEEEVRELLSEYGNVVGLYPRTRQDGIRIGGWNFFIHLERKMPDNVLYEDQHFEVIYPGKTRPVPKVKPPPPKQTAETTEVAKPPIQKQPDVSEKESLPFPDSPITIILEKRTPRNRETTDVDESNKGRKRRRLLRKNLYIETEEIPENNVK